MLKKMGAVDWWIDGLLGLGECAVMLRVGQRGSGGSCAPSVPLSLSFSSFLSCVSESLSLTHTVSYLYHDHDVPQSD